MNLSAAVVIVPFIAAMSLAGCGGGSGGAFKGAPSVPPSAPSAGVTPTVAPAGTSGNNIGVTLPSGDVISGAAVVGEVLPTQTGTAITPGGTTIKVRHGFFPGNQPPTPAGPG